MCPGTVTKCNIIECERYGVSIKFIFCDIIFMILAFLIIVMLFFLVAYTLRKSRSLTELYLSCCKMRANSAVTVAKALCNNFMLQKLIMSGNPIEEQGFLALADMLKENSALQSLDLVGCTTGTDGILNIVQVLQQNMTLKSLMLSKEHLANFSCIAVYSQVQDRIQWCPSNNVGEYNIKLYLLQNILYRMVSPDMYI